MGGLRVRVACAILVLGMGLVFRELTCSSNAISSARGCATVLVMFLLCHRLQTLLPNKQPCYLPWHEMHRLGRHGATRRACRAIRALGYTDLRCTALCADEKK